jgi:hypothetical protein
MSANPMDRYRLWPLIVLLVAGMAYFVFTGDETEVKQGPQTEAPASRFTPPSYSNLPELPQSGDRTSGYQPRPDSRFGGYPYSEGDYAPLSPAGSYRFRPLEPDDKAARYRPYAFAPPAKGTDPYQPHALQGPGNTWGYGPDYPPDDAFAQYGFPTPGGTNYRFRPLEEARNTKRWSGNYPSRPPASPELSVPYYRNDYLPPQRAPRPAGGSRSLWANSLPED